MKVLLDSGAYSAWNRDQSIDLADYIDFVREVGRHVWRYANLDIIPGATATASERRDAAIASYRNLQKMRDAGLRPLPVFHFLEPWTFLDQMLADGYGYIGLGGLVGKTPVQQHRWLHQVFARLDNGTGKTRVKVHGFGMTNLHFLSMYPWTTVDSTSWSKYAANVEILIPRETVPGSGAPNYRAAPLHLFVPNRGKEGKRQYRDLGPQMQDWIDRYLAEHVDCRIGDCYESVIVRKLINGLYLDRAATLAGSKLVFVTDATDKVEREVLDRIGSIHRLLSFYHLRGRPQLLAQYLNP